MPGHTTTRALLPAPGSNRTATRHERTRLERRRRRAGLARGAALGLLSLLAPGCYNPSVSISGRSALEQQLTRTALMRAIDGLAVHKEVLKGTWRIVVLAPDSSDLSWIQGYLHLKLTQLGATITTQEGEAVSVVVAAVVYAGSDIDNFYVGFPVPGGGGQALALYQSITDRGRAQLFLSFQDSSGRLIATTPTTKGEAHYTDTFFLTVLGPFAFTDLDIDTSSRFSELADDMLRHPEQWIPPDTAGPAGAKQAP